MLSRSKKPRFVATAFFLTSSLFLSASNSPAYSAPEYPPVLGGCSKQTTSSFVINTPNISTVRVNLDIRKTKEITLKVNRGISFQLTGIQVGRRVEIAITPPSGKRLDLKPSVLSTGGRLCPTNFIFTRTGTFLVSFSAGSIKRIARVQVIR